jgi:hypothetical protein
MRSEPGGMSYREDVAPGRLSWTLTVLFVQERLFFPTAAEFL